MSANSCFAFASAVAASGTLAGGCGSSHTMSGGNGSIASVAGGVSVPGTVSALPPTESTAGSTAMSTGITQPPAEGCVLGVGLNHQLAMPSLLTVRLEVV